MQINIKLEQVIQINFSRNFKKNFSLETNYSLPGEKVNDLSKYLPLRFLVCMISAIANPFLYGYFNETFKDGLQKIFSLCCPQMMRDKNQLCYNKTDMLPLELTLEKHQNGGFGSRSNFYRANFQKYSTNNILIHPSTRLTIKSTNNLSPSLLLNN
jgi:hypothetical protein